MWRPDFSYVKGAYKDSDEKGFLFKKKRKPGQPEDLAKPIPPMKAFKNGF